MFNTSVILKMRPSQGGISLQVCVLKVELPLERSRTQLLNRTLFVSCL
jgi:hypothetical protein